MPTRALRLPSVILLLLVPAALSSCLAELVATLPPAQDIDGGPRDAGGSAPDGGAVVDAGTPARDSGVQTVVAACGGDGGLGPVGVWQQVWLPQSFMPDPLLETTAVAIDPVDQSVYVGAASYTNGGNSGTGIYRSTDCGGSFHLASTGNLASALTGGNPWAMRMDPAGSGALYVVIGYGPLGIYESTDHGANFSLLDADPAHTSGAGTAFVQALDVSPDGHTLAVTFHENCTNPYTATCFSLSTNAGATWTDINGPPNGGGWQEGSSITILGPNTLIFLGAYTGAAYTNNAGTSWSSPTFEDAAGQPITPQFYESYSGSTHVTPDGKLYVATYNGVFGSTGATPGTAWTQLANSPQAGVLTDDGTYLYASWTGTGTGKYGNGNGQVFWRAPLSNLTGWTQMKSPDVPRGSCELTYDPVHHVIYSANMIGGLWRLVTQ